MLEAFDGDPAHKCLGRAAPARLRRALSYADETDLAVPKLREIYASTRRNNKTDPRSRGFNMYTFSCKHVSPCSRKRGFDARMSSAFVCLFVFCFCLCVAFSPFSSAFGGL